MANLIRVLLVDDHAVVRSGLAKFLIVNKDMELVGEAGDGSEAIQMAALHKPDVILMDLMMPVMDGITATKEIHKKYPNIRIIALTSFAEQNLVQGALQAGVTGYMQKNVTALELANAIRSAAAGRMTLSSDATMALANAVTLSHLPENALTEREVDVLRCMVNGADNKEIASKLFVSLGTVKFHISNIYRKLGAENRVEAVMMAMERKLV